MNLKRELKYAVFDMDGLMFDTERLLVQAFQTQVSGVAGCQFPEKDLKRVLGMNFKDTENLFKDMFKSRIPFSECWRLANIWIDNYIGVHGVPQKPGLLALLEWMKARDIHMAVATGSDRETARRYLSGAGVLAYFEVIIGGDMVLRGKPDPLIFEIAVNILGCEDKRECVVLDDSANGLLAAYRAGIPLIAVPDLIDPTVGNEGMYLAKAANLTEVISILPEYWQTP